MFWGFKNAKRISVRSEKFAQNKQIGFSLFVKRKTEPRDSTTLSKYTADRLKIE
jgi:hypothetical protein